uniref:Uncharacterized protein n=1 Tax=Tetranychus urticae TaxID=32264 RepID=T1KJC2_TETUR
MHVNIHDNNTSKIYKLIHEMFSFRCKILGVPRSEKQNLYTFE